MKAQAVSRIFTFSLLIAFTSSVINAQAKDEPKADNTAAALTRIDSNDSPILVQQRPANLVGESSEGKISYLFFNTTKKPIRAFAWVTDTGSGPKLAVSLYNKGHRPELTLLGSIFSDQEEPRFTFDWVLFTDGSVWGPDDHGRSGEILGYFKGWHTVAARAAELVGEPDSATIMTTLDGPWQTSWSIELPLKTSRGEKEYFRKGYDMALARLLNDREITQLKIPKQITDQLKKELREMQSEVPQQ